MNSSQAGMVISLGCYLAIGWYAGKRVKHLEDFFVAGRNGRQLGEIGHGGTIPTRLQMTQHGRFLRCLKQGRSVDRESGCGKVSNRRG